MSRITWRHRVSLTRSALSLNRSGPKSFMLGENQRWKPTLASSTVPNRSKAFSNPSSSRVRGRFDMKRRLSVGIFLSFFALDWLSVWPPPPRSALNLMLEGQSLSDQWLQLPEKVHRIGKENVKSKRQGISILVGKRDAILWREIVLCCTATPYHAFTMANVFVIHTMIFSFF